MNLHETGGTPHHHRLRVYYADTDAGGVVYHANYLRFAERARTEALRDMGIPHAEMVSLHGLMFMVRRIKVDYLGSARLDDSLIVTVEDHGIGIPLDDQARLGEPFYRGRNARDISGTGLGFAIVQRCVGLLGGAIELQSQPEQGTRITLRLPRHEHATRG